MCITDHLVVYLKLYFNKICILRRKMDNQQEPTVWHSELCPMLSDSLDTKGVWGRMDTCIHD